jgi:hypothetical protein
VSAYRGSTLLGSSTTTLTVGTFTYVETLVTVHNTTGAVTVRFNGTSVLSLSNQNTRGGTGDAWNEVRLGWFSPSGAYNPEWDFDDIYILDGAGSGPWNTFLGDCRVDPSYPDAAGATSGWTASTGANYTTVDETTPNDDTDYVSTSTVNAVDTYAFQAAPVAGATIFGIQHCLSMKKADAGLCVVAPIVRHSGTDYVGSGLSPSTSYGYGLQIAQTNPGTSAQWTETDFNSAEFGFKRTS